LKHKLYVPLLLFRSGRIIDLKNVGYTAHQYGTNPIQLCT